MTSSTFLVLLALACVLALTTAFAPSSSARASFTRASVTKSAGPRLKMSAESEAERLKAQAAKLREEVAAETKPAAPAPNADGTFYDDETPEYKDPLSDNMRARLLKEASTGLDSDKKQTNVILYISIAVAILIALGGQGILY